jgi:molecular chaperone GrpE
MPGPRKIPVQAVEAEPSATRPAPPSIGPADSEERMQAEVDAVVEQQSAERVAAQPAEPTSEAEATRALEDELAQARAQQEQLLAEFKNYRRHAEAELARVHQRARVELLAELADTVQAIEAAGSATADAGAVREGVALVGRNLKRIFEAHGLQRIPTVGQAFDPRLHEAVFSEPVEGLDKGTVVREVSPGFCTEEAVIRPAKVSVAA